MSKTALKNKYLGPVVQKPINANPGLKINQGVYIYSIYSQLLLNGDTRQNFTFEVNLEKQEEATETFTQK